MSERTPQDVLRELRATVTALEYWDKRSVPGGMMIHRAEVLALIDKAIAEAPDSPTAKGAGEALAMALADTGYVDPHPTEQYQLVETLPILAALRHRGFVIRSAPDTLSEKPGLDVPSEEHFVRLATAVMNVRDFLALHRKATGRSDVNVRKVLRLLDDALGSTDSEGR